MSAHGSGGLIVFQLRYAFAQRSGPKSSSSARNNIAAYSLQASAVIPNDNMRYEIVIRARRGKKKKQRLAE